MTNAIPVQIAMAKRTRLRRWRPGKVIGFPLMHADNLPNAITEPVHVTAPMNIPTQVSMSWIEKQNAGIVFKGPGIKIVCEADEHRQTSDQTVQDGDEFGHLRHLNAKRKQKADGPAQRDAGGKHPIVA